MTQNEIRYVLRYIAVRRTGLDLKKTLINNDLGPT